MSDQRGESAPAAGAAGQDPDAPGAQESGEWIRALSLFLLATSMAVVHPAILIALPVMALVVLMPAPAVTTAVVLLAGWLLLVTGAPRDGLWYAERGWGVLAAGAFAAATLRWPKAPFLKRGIAAVTASAAVAAIVFTFHPGAWEILDWLVADRMQAGVASVLAVLDRLRGPEAPLPPALVSTFYEAADAQARVFPALLGLGTLTSLGVAWWIYVRVVQGNRGALGPLRDFRFNDVWIWLFIGGLALMVVDIGQAWDRVGVNALMFIGAIYAARGAAVVVFLTGAPSLLGSLVLVAAIVLMAPAVLAAAVFVGVSDTWLKLRERVGGAAGT